MGKKGLFTERERRAILYLLPLLGVAAWVVYAASRPRFEQGGTRYADAVLTPADPPAATQRRYDTAPAADSAARLFPFDPNTVTYHDLLRLGFSRSEALGIVKYRVRGKVFEIAEDFASCYTVSEEAYLRLLPYIRIGERYRLKPFASRSPVDSGRRMQADTLPLVPFRLDTAGAAYLSRIGFSKRQAEALIRYRDMRGGLRDMEEVAACYVVSPAMAARLAGVLLFDSLPGQTPVELNTADSAALRSVRGIGERTVLEIIRYRERLGGFVRAEQLAEVRGMREANYRMILQQIRCDSCVIQKIDINFAHAETLTGHPYLPPPVLRKLLKHRQLKGGWRNLEELVEQRILTREQAERIGPYLRFGERPLPTQQGAHGPHEPNFN